MPLDLFGDFGWNAGSNPAASKYFDSQSCINYYPELSPSKESKEVVALLSAPGLIQVAAAPGGGAPGYSTSQTVWPQPSSITTLPVRGSWVLPGRTTALVVVANICYLATITAYGSNNTTGALLLQKVGTLATNTGPVVIRDNGVQGGYAILVDNPNGYLYNLNTQAFSQVSDPNWLGAATVAEIDGIFIFGQPNTALFWTTPAPYSIAFNASYFSYADASSDLLMAVMESKEELWLIKEQTAEIWYNAGGQYFAFQRLVGTLLQVGCKATYSVARLSTQGEDGLIWFGRSDRGENVVVRTRGLSYDVVSTPAISDAIASYVTTSDAIGYTYQEDGHEFYVLSFPTADQTWVYDATLPPPLAWTQRLSYDPYAQAFHRHRSNCQMNFGGMRVVGDYQNGALYQMTRSVQNDAGWPLFARRRAPHVWSKQDRRRVFMSSLQIDFAPGQGASSGLGANPTANLYISRDGGTSLGTPYEMPSGNPFPASMGAIGQYQNRALWRRLGWARDSVAQVDVIAPVNRDVMGATLKTFGDA
jgi:hypothetical protein